MKGKSKPKMIKHAVAKGSSDGMHAMAKKEHHMKKGGHFAHGGHVKHRADKKARGGKTMTPSSPLSGAEPKDMKESKFKLDKEND